MQEPVIENVPKLRVIMLQWSAEHGDCQECGLPAAFLANGDNLCAVCAAGRAADGEPIQRIAELA